MLEGWRSPGGDYGHPSAADLLALDEVSAVSRAQIPHSLEMELYLKPQGGFSQKPGQGSKDEVSLLGDKMRFSGAFPGWVDDSRSAKWTEETG